MDNETKTAPPQDLAPAAQQIAGLLDAVDDTRLSAPTPAPASR